MTCTTHGCALHYQDHGSKPVCPRCRAASEWAMRVQAASATANRRGGRPLERDGA